MHLFSKEANTLVSSLHVGYLSAQEKKYLHVPQYGWVASPVSVQMLYSKVVPHQSISTRDNFSLRSDRSVGSYVAHHSYLLISNFSLIYLMISRRL